MSGPTDRRPLVAVVGSFDTERDYRPSIKDPERLRGVCAEVGREIARRECDLLVFSSKEKYAETAAAHGFLEASDAGPRTIVARLSRYQEYVLEPDEGSDARVQVIRDPSGEWEVPYYRALMEVDGIVLVGGGRSTRVAGILALAQRIPVAPLSVFGGAAEQVWVHLDKSRNQAVDEDLELLGAPWTEGSARSVVDSLLRQARDRVRRQARERRQQRNSGLMEVFGLVLAAVFLVLALFSMVAIPQVSLDATGIALMVAAPMFAAVAGALIRDSFGTEQSWLKASVRGLGAGMVSVLLFVSAQLLLDPDALLNPSALFRLSFFLVPVGFTAGFTFDLVFDRLRHAEALRPTELVSPSPGGTPTEEIRSP